MTPTDYALSTYKTQAEWLVAEVRKIEASGEISTKKLKKIIELQNRLFHLKKEFQAWEKSHS